MISDTIKLIGFEVPKVVVRAFRAANMNKWSEATP